MNHKRKTSIRIFAVVLLICGSLSFVRNDFEIAKNLDIYATLLRQLNENYVDDINVGDLVRTSIDAMLEELDPYTVYYLHTLYVWDKKNRKYAQMHRLIRSIRQRHYDVAVNVQRFAATGWICLRSGAAKTIGFDKNPFSRLFTVAVPHEISSEKYLYEADRNQRLIANLTDGEAAPTRLYPTDSDEQAVSGYKEQPYLTISPASLWKTKQYPEERWTELVHKADHRYRIFLLGSSAS